MNEVHAVTREDIPVITRLLAKHGGPIYADIWVFGLNTALRISDLLALRMADVVGKDELVLVEQKTGKTRRLTLNGKAQALIAQRAAAHPADVWLFQATGNRAKGAQQPIRRETVARKFQEVGAILGLDLGTHSMRKTRGAAMYRDGVPLETICKVMNHSSPAVTMRYIGLDRATVAKTYADYEL